MISQLVLADHFTEIRKSVYFVGLFLHVNNLLVMFVIGHDCTAFVSFLEHIQCGRQTFTVSLCV